MEYLLSLSQLPEVRLVGRMVYPKGWHKVTTHRSNVFLYMKSGRFDFEVGERNFSLSSGEILLFPAGAKYKISAGEDCDFRYLHFSPSTGDLREFANSESPEKETLLMPEKCNFSDDREALERLERRIARCEASFVSADKYSALRLSNDFLSFLLFIAGYHAESLVPELPHTVRRIKKYVDEHLRENITLSSISDMTGLSKQYIMRLFKKYTGETLTHYANASKLAYAQKLLRESDLNIEEIAYELGFCGSYYFCRLHKKYFGITPSEYRESADEIL